MRRENGFALPIVVFILMIVVFLCFFLISQLVRHKQSTLLYSETLEAQYAAESGIAFMQQQLKHNPNNDQDLFFQWSDFFVSTKVVDRQPLIEIEAKSIGRYGVRQTIRVKVDPKTLAVCEWLK